MHTLSSHLSRCRGNRRCFRYPRGTCTCQRTTPFTILATLPVSSHRSTTRSRQVRRFGRRIQLRGLCQLVRCLQNL